MALELLSFQWQMIIFLAFHAVAAIQESDVEEMLNYVYFDCTLDINGSSWNMECDSNNFDFKSTEKFVTSKLYGPLNIEKLLTFEDIVNSTSFNNSEIYLCDSEWRYFILKDKSMLSSNCALQNSLSRIIYSMNESSLLNIEIIHIEKPELTLNILPKCLRLESIVISHNSIPEMHFLPIHSNNTVKTLSLKANSIQFIKDKLFAKFHNLKSLDLSHNLLTSVNRSLFYGITSTTELSLSHNIIEYVSADSLKDLKALEHISLSNNKLQNLDSNIFKYSNLLSRIDLSENNFKNLPETLFQNMQNLKNVSCTNCSLIDLDKNIFKNSSNLVWFLCNRNHLQSIHPDTFKDINFLEVIDMSNNDLSYLNSSLFSNHPYLRYVNISENKITDLNLGVFSGARNVRYLDFGYNKIISGLADDYFKNFTDVEILGLHHNMITTVELGIAGPVRVRNLDVSYNLVTKLHIRWKQLILIEVFNANNNLLTRIDLPPCIPNMKQTLTFNFEHNRISRVNMEALLFDEKRVKTDRTLTCFFNGLARNYVNLTNNPLNCDCRMYSFQKYIQQKSPRQYEIEIFVDKENIMCDKPDFLRNLTLVSLPDDILSCPLDVNCPKHCYCGVRGKDNSIFVNCSSSALEEVPQIYPQGTTVLYFNGNSLKSMESLNNDTWSNLVELHLDYNFLSSLDDWVFPLSLRYLSVRGNKLKTLPRPLMQFISNQTDFQLYFGNNDFNCDCDRKYFKNFLRESIEFIMDNDDILCNLTNNNTFELLPLTSVFDSVLCSQEYKSVVRQTELIIGLCVFFSALIVMLLIYYRQRQVFLSYFYVHCRSLYDVFYADAVDNDAIFDAFIAYSSDDRAIVLQLLEELENNPPYFHLCIHERNWLPGRFITDNIADSVENSRRTIILLSSTFITSPWFNVELRAAVCKMAQDAVNRIIVVLTDKTASFDNIDPELRYVVSKRTYLEWGERWFWEKLRYALPRKSIKDSQLDCLTERSVSEVALIPYKNQDENVSDEAVWDITS